MVYAHGQDIEAVPSNPAVHKRSVQLAQIKFANAHLNSYFPTNRRAYEFLIRRICDQLFGVIRQLRVIPNKPQEGMRIQKQFHAIYSLKSSRGASKSSAIQWLLLLALP